jgi:DNA-binding transcriptional regulator YiaG
MTMQLSMMNTLYDQGLYSPMNYYLGVLALIKDGAKIPSVMAEIPDALLGMILDIAEKHRESCTGETGRKEAAIVGRIVAWGKRRRSVTAPNLEADAPSRRSILRLLTEHELTVEQIALQLDVPPSRVSAWERGVRIPTGVARTKIDAMIDSLERHRTGRRVAAGERTRETAEPQGRSSTHRRSQAQVPALERRTRESEETPNAVPIAAEKRRDRIAIERKAVAKARDEAQDAASDGVGGDEKGSRSRSRRSGAGDSS